MRGRLETPSVTRAKPRRDGRLFAGLGSKPSVLPDVTSQARDSHFRQSLVVTVVDLIRSPTNRKHLGLLGVGSVAVPASRRKSRRAKNLIVELPDHARPRSGRVQAVGPFLILFGMAGAALLRV